MDFDYTGKSKIALDIFDCMIMERTYIVFFEDCLVSIKLEKSFVKKTNKMIKAKCIDEEIGLFKRMDKELEFWDDYKRRFLYMTPEQIESEFENVITMDYSDIRKYSMIGPELGGSAEVDTGGSILIKDNNHKIDCLHNYKESDPKYQRIESLLKAKIKK